MLDISEKTVIKLHPLEQQVLDKFLSKSNKEFSSEDRNILRKQFEASIILERRMTGHGFFTKFLVSESAPRLGDRKTSWFAIGVHAEIPGLERGAGFQLRIQDGVLSDLEGFAYNQTWPDPWPGAFSEPETYKLTEVTSEAIDTRN
jgi:hypothetical protein